MEDHDLDRLLKQASKPELPHGFDQRLRARLDASPKSAEIIAFRPRAVAVEKKPRWLIGVPLAASLLLGIALGAQGQTSSIFASDVDTAFADDITTGLEEAEEAAEEI